MLRSLYSGISSLRSHQTMLDVTGNNIANVNTTGFKAGRTQFSDTLSQVMMAAGAPQGAEGGTNPAQVGLGVQVSAITNDFGVGASQQTGRALDMMIDGDGFFVVRSGSEQLYTRAGAFTLDAVGNLVTADGAKVQGWMADTATGAIDTNGPLTGITMPLTTTMPAKATTSVTFSGNLPADLPAGPDGIRRSAITVYDSAGTEYELELTYTKLAVPTTPGANSEWTVTAMYTATDGTSSGDLAGGATVAFNASGQIDPGDVSITLGTYANLGAITVGMADVDGYATKDDISADVQDGMGAGTLQSFSMDPNGTLVGSFTNGRKQPVGQIAIGSFANMAGLEKAGESTFRTTVNSGNPQIGTAGTGSRGPLTGGALEMSNVDLSQEFTNLIVAQRGFQAGSRVITTSDELLQELVNLKR
ncbi:MAG: flagellar hook protein FlgE [Georgenia sp.]